MIWGLVTDDVYGKNQLFNEHSPLNRDDCLLVYRKLREELKKHCCDLATHDTTKPHETTGYIFMEYNKHFIENLAESGFAGHKYLIIHESEVIRRDNWIEANHKNFDVVFTWHPGLAEKRSVRPYYVRYYWHNNLARKTPAESFEKRRGFCVVMAGNKWSYHPLELYSERLKTIRWFMENHPDKIDLYGPGWNSPPLRKFNDALRYVFRSVILSFLLGKSMFSKTRFFSWFEYPFYRGLATSKLKTLRDYRFCICYENARNIPGYITEKIFDCFLAGVVPVYWGWEGVSTLIPPTAFIDRTQFESHEDLYDFLDSMDAPTYNRYLESIDSFLESEACALFSIENFVDTIINEVLLASPLQSGS